MSKRKIANFNYFEKINSEEKAYWLGFIYADGGIYSHTNYPNNNYLAIGLQLTDKQHLRKFLKAMEANHSIFYDEQLINKKIYKRARVTMANKKLIEDLIKLGVVYRKTYSKNISFDGVPKKYLNAFIRGYFDGDGYIGETKLVITGTFSITNAFIKYLKQHNIVSYRIYTKGPTLATRDIVVACVKERRKLAHLLYKNASIYLDRKYQTYLEYYS